MGHVACCADVCGSSPDRCRSSQDALFCRSTGDCESVRLMASDWGVRSESNVPTKLIAVSGAGIIAAEKIVCAK